MAFLRRPITAPPSSPVSLPSFATPIQNSTKFTNWVRSKSFNFVLSGALTLGLSLSGKYANGVLLIQIQEKRLAQEIADIENDTGFKLRVLAQNYPETPGMLNLLDLLGEDASIEAAVMAISNCLREPVGPNNCSEVK
ncbi:thylakoid lumenal 15.0 kda protein 2 [Quercus suber]|uniref:Thylakoid lumenal 15.0 kDa protein 2 n=1 Tax=Quercus suber TaxID=58331 RepID=A0AAW0IYX9_QUESU